MNRYLVATIKPWNIQAFERHSVSLPGEWKMVNTPEQLTTSFLEEYKPRYIFFPHWSWIVPEQIVDHYECVCFHMTDVPYGRGGSPLQNLIERGHKETKLTALRMVTELDAGPIYTKIPLDLSGSAQEIFERVAHIIYDALRYIVEKQPEPQPQTGEITIFKRRTPEMSVLPSKATPESLYNHIRMLDAQTYPPAFIEWGDYILEFSDAALIEEGVESHVRLRKKTDAKDK